MTKNEIDYLSMKESQRHNTVMEQETARHNKKDEQVRSRANDVQREGYLINQGVQLANLGELQRHNAITENESIRHNIQDEQIRHESNILNYTSAMRSANVAEQVGAWNYEVGSRNASSTATDVITRRMAQEETSRHNKRGEDLQGYSILVGAVNGMFNSVANMAKVVIPY